MKKINSIELFAGAGGLALGLEKSGINVVALNEYDKNAIETLKLNRPKWNIIGEDINKIIEKKFLQKLFKVETINIDLVTGGFPCQPFSYAGKKLGTDDDRGNLYKSFAIVVDYFHPKIFLAENVPGLISLQNGKIFADLIKEFEKLNYKIFFKILNANDFEVAQKRKRVFIVGVRNDIYKTHGSFEFPQPNFVKPVLHSVLKNVPNSEGVFYNEAKKKILEMVPPGGCWRNLPLKIAKEYLKKSFYLGGGKTGIARRLSYDEPSLTLTTSPFQKQTERCHPEFTRPFSVREYARIQSFPDSWTFFGSKMNKYKQIGNAVPVNLAYHVGLAIISYLNKANEKK